MQRSMSLVGKSQSTLTNYSRCLAHLAFHFNCSPIELDTEQVLDYLHFLKDQHHTPSESFFKHTVYGLRYVYRLFDMEDRRISLPSIARDKKLPVVLSKEEMRRLLNTPKLLKHRLVLAVLYGCGLRCFELRNLQIKDIDFHRLTLHVRRGKGRKDRYVPISHHLKRGIKTYLEAERPKQWLFNGCQPDGKLVAMSSQGIQWIVGQARKESGISKDLTTHTLRHTYATHLLEDGLDILSIKELLGHAHIETTLVYLHVSHLGRNKPFSPLDTLFTKQ